MPNVLSRVAVRNRRCGVESDPTNRTQPLDEIVDGRMHFAPRVRPPTGIMTVVSDASPLQSFHHGPDVVQGVDVLVVS